MTMKSASDEQCLVTDGLRALGMVKPVGQRFEVFLARGDELDYVATADSRADAIALLRQACAKPPSVAQERRQ